MKTWNQSDYEDRLATLSARAKGESGETRGWFIIRTNPRAEMLAFDGLERIGFEPWMPMAQHLRRRRHTKSRRSILKPVLTGYLFARVPLTPESWGKLAKVDGVRAVLGLEDRVGGVRPLPANEVERYQRFAESGVFNEDRAKAHWRRDARTSAQVYSAGQSVRMKDGPYAGMVVRFDGYKGSQAARVLVELFGSLLPVEIDPARLSAVV